MTGIFNGNVALLAAMEVMDDAYKTLGGIKDPENSIEKKRMYLIITNEFAMKFFSRVPDLSFRLHSGTENV